MVEPVTEPCRALAAPELLGVEEGGRPVAVSPEVPLYGNRRGNRGGRAEPGSRALAAGEPCQRKRDQEAAWPAERGHGSEQAPRQWPTAQCERGGPGGGGQRERVRVRERERERAGPAGEREGAAQP